MKSIAPQTLAKIEKRWPQMRPSCLVAGITDEEKIHQVVGAARHCSLRELGDFYS